MKNFLVLCCLAYGFVPVLCAQEPPPTSPPPAPSEPILEKAPEFAQWTVTSENAGIAADKPSSDESASKSPSPTPANNRSRHSSKAAAESSETKLVAERKTFVTKTKTIRYERVSAKGVDDSERWCLPGIQITVQNGAISTVSLPKETQNSSYTDYSQTDFDEFDWLSPSNFKNTEQVNGQECYVFREKVKEQRGNSTALVEKTACINTATRLPVTLQEDEKLMTFRFDVAPTAMLKPPPNVMVRVEEWKKSVQQSELMPARP